MDGRRVLVVDDEPGMRAGLGEVLRRDGFEVDGAASAEDALARLGAGIPDLLVTDLRLPGRSGVDLLRELRARVQPFDPCCRYPRSRTRSPR